MNHSNNWLEILYLVILVTFIASQIMMRKDMSVNKALKYIGAWAGIALFCIILYSYRFEFESLRQRIAGEIYPSKVRNNDLGQVIINLSQDNHFYVDVKINGQKVRFMIDTGASDMVLNIADAKRVGINLENLVFNKIYQTANGKSYGASVNLDSLEFGEILMRNVRVSVNSADMGVSLLGMSFLRKFKKYEFYQDRLILTP